MSNIKQVQVVGLLPFNYFEHPMLCMKMAAIQSPSIGFAIDFKPAPYRPNLVGGKTAMYAFTLSGYEAVPIAWLQDFKKYVEQADGEVTEFHVIDFETKEVLS